MHKYPVVQYVKCRVMFYYDDVVTCVILQMREFVNTSERDAVPVSDVVDVIMTAATTIQPEVRAGGVCFIDKI